MACLGSLPAAEPAARHARKDGVRRVEARVLGGSPHVLGPRVPVVMEAGGLDHPAGAQHHQNRVDLRSRASQAVGEVASRGGLDVKDAEDGLPERAALLWRKERIHEGLLFWLRAL